MCKEIVYKILRKSVKILNKLHLLRIRPGFYNIEPGKIYFDSSVEISALFRKFGIHEPQTNKWIKENVKPSIKILEIGSCLGYFTLYLAKATGENGKVYAVEGSKPYLEKLNKTILENKNLNIQLIPKFFGNEKGSVSLNDIFSKDNIDLIFMDIEGHELEVFDQLLEMDAKPEIYVELHPHIVGKEKINNAIKKLSRYYIIKKVWQNHAWLIPKNKDL